MILALGISSLKWLILRATLLLTWLQPGLACLQWWARGLARVFVVAHARAVEAGHVHVGVMRDPAIKQTQIHHTTQSTQTNIGALYAKLGGDMQEYYNDIKT